MCGIISYHTQNIEKNLDEKRIIKRKLVKNIFFYVCIGYTTVQMWVMNLTFELSEYEKNFLFELCSSNNNNNTIEEKVEKFSS